MVELVAVLASTSYWFSSQLRLFLQFFEFEFLNLATPLPLSVCKQNYVNVKDIYWVVKR